MSEPPVIKKRGRKKKEETEVTVTTQEKPAEPKKRGRKPKGGKLLLNDQLPQNNTPSVANVILHLKCSMKDINENLEQEMVNPLQYNPVAPPTIKAYEPVETSHFADYNQIKESQTDIVAYPDNPTTGYTCVKCKKESKPETEDDDDISEKDLDSKLKELKLMFYRNNVHDKRSACFWCTYDFDNQPCYIPKYEMNNEVFGYGSFCRPPCAVAYLMKENIDDSVKFERYQLLNQIYGKIYNYKQNIKPSPDPYMLLEKYYGNMNIKEYRKLLNSDHILMVVEKPMTRLLPELHEDNDDSKKNSSYQQTGMYKVKKQSEKSKGPTKNEILMETFGK